METENRKKDLVSALNAINCGSLTREEWLYVGMALKAEGIPPEAWDMWSATDTARYKPGECSKLWKGFKRSGITGNTVFKLAAAHGWKGTRNVYVPPKDSHTAPGKPVQRATDPAQDAQQEYWREQAEQLKRLKKILHGHNRETVSAFYEPGEEWQPERDAERYLTAVFQPEEIVSITAESATDGQKARPAGTGTFRKAGELVELFKRFAVDEVIKYNHSAGCWIRVNPLDGEYINADNVTAYRHVLVESDALPISEQIYLIHELRLPVSALSYSGNKSVHALVKIQAETEQEYSRRVRFLFDICNRYGLQVDTSNSPANKLSRFPGFFRGEHKQFLIETETGCSSWTEWERLILKGLNGIELLSSELKQPLPLKPVLIEGLLRNGHKMIVAASSKAGKTFLMMNLALCISEGLEWLGHKCTAGKVLYLNMEIDSASAEDRFIKLSKDLRLSAVPRNVDLMNLRGESEPLNSLAERIITTVKAIGEQYAAIVIDPLYKVLEGDENSNSDMARMARSGDKIAEATGAAVIYVHHFSKGTQAGKRAQDRPSGAGTFIRDPDAAVYLTQYDPRTVNNELVFEVAYTAREFPPAQPDMVRFQYPAFEMVDPEEYPDAAFVKLGQTETERGEKRQRLEEATATAYKACNEVTAGNGETGVLKKDLYSELLKLYPERAEKSRRNNEKELIENNPALRQVGKFGRETVYMMAVTL